MVRAAAENNGYVVKYGHTHQMYLIYMDIIFNLLRMTFLGIDKTL